MTFGSDDTVTFLYGYADTTTLTVSGVLNASDDNFSAGSLGSIPLISMSLRTAR